MDQVDSHRPEYSLEEREEEIVLTIVAPLSKPKEAAFVLEKNVFTFESPPYLLKMKLPHAVCDRFSHQAYDSETKTYKIKLKKNFQPEQNDVSEEDDEEAIDPTANSEGVKTAKFFKGVKTAKASQNEGEKQFYGFANKYSNMFGKLYEEFSEVINLPNPDYTGVSERRNLRLEEESEKWNDDHYLADTMETDHLETIFTYKPPWVTSPLKDDFCNEEKEILDELINKSKISTLSEESVHLSELQIVDILFGYAYNERTTEGDDTVESGWTINKLSSTLSWFEVFENMKTVLVSCYRRSLIFPLFRNWNLTEMVHKDVVDILRAGPKQVTRCLLEVRDIFNDSENRYLLNSLYVNDLCNFAYHMTEESCSRLAEEVYKVNITKYEVNKDIPLLEVAAHLTLEEEKEGSDKVQEKVKKIVDEIALMHIESESTDSESEYDGSESSEGDD